MEKCMTECEYKTGNRIALTYFMQVAAAILMISSLYLGYRKLADGHFPGTQTVLFAINLGLFFFQAHIRRTLQARR